MGSDDLFHKRKAKSAKNLRRKRAKRSPYERILIVCEGEKTEPNYFKEIVRVYELNTANIVIDGKCGSSPMSVFEYAESLWDVEDAKGDSYDRVYCVFDKDSHETYGKALNMIRGKKPENTFFAANSVPCFEYWFLLHFTYTTKPHFSAGNASSADSVIKDLKQYMPDYSKGNEGIFSILFNRLKFAKENAEKSLICSSQNGTDNPSTTVHKLVDYLENLKS